MEILAYILTFLGLAFAFETPRRWFLRIFGYKITSSNKPKEPSIKLFEALNFCKTMREIAESSPHEAILHSWNSIESAALEVATTSGLKLRDNPPTATLIDTLVRSGLIDKNIELLMHNLFGVRNESLGFPSRFNYDDAIAYIDHSAKTIVSLKEKIAT